MSTIASSSCYWHYRSLPKVNMHVSCPCNVSKTPGIRIEMRASGANTDERLSAVGPAVRLGWVWLGWLG